MPMYVTVVAHDKTWAKKFQDEAKLIKEILKDNCVEIHHIGSTAVDGLCAKPIIDIMPVVKDINAVDSLQEEFAKIGYEYLGELGIVGRRYLRKGGDNRTHQIHIFERENEKEIQRHLAVRDYLRCHKSDAEKYGKLKKSLAGKYPFDLESYCDGKDEFVKDIELKALKWIGEK